MTKPGTLENMKIPEILRGFDSLVEDEFDNVSDENVNMWRSNFIGTDARMTP